MTAFALLRLAEEVRSGELSRWSEPVPLPKADSHVDVWKLRDQIATALASGAPESASSSHMAFTSPAKQLGDVARELQGLQESIMKEAAQDSLQDLMYRALTSLSRSLQPREEAVDNQAWRADLSSAAASGSSPARSGARAYCTALQQCLLHATPGNLLLPRRGAVMQLPPHMRETAWEIQAELLPFRGHERSAAPRCYDGRQSAPVPGLMQAAATAAAREELQRLLHRFAAQASACSGDVFHQELADVSAAVSAFLSRQGPRPPAALKALSTQLVQRRGLSPVPDGACRAASETQAAVAEAIRAVQQCVAKRAATQAALPREAQYRPAGVQMHDQPRPVYTVQLYDLQAKAA